MHSSKKDPLTRNFVFKFYPNIAVGFIHNEGFFASLNRVFSKYTRMAIMSILAPEALFRDNKKFQLQNATLVSIESLDL